MLLPSIGTWQSKETAWIESWSLPNWAWKPVDCLSHPLTYESLYFCRLWSHQWLYSQVFPPPLALWCTLQDVESMEIFSKSPSIARAWKTASKIPASLHFQKQAYTVCHGPYLSGSSLHGAPHLAIHNIPFNAVRLSYFAGRPRFPSFGCSGGSISLIRFHSLSVSS